MQHESTTEEKKNYCSIEAVYVATAESILIKEKNFT